MFRGLTATFTREMPGYFFFFLAYEATRGLLAGPGQSKEDIGPLRTVVAGGVAGVTLWTIIFPADVIKSRLQAGQNIVQNNFKMCKKRWVLGFREIIIFDVFALANFVCPSPIWTCI